MAQQQFEISESGALRLPEYQEQEALLDFAVPAVPYASSVPNPVAEVLVDSPGAGWDPIYHYEIPAQLADKIVLGCRVKVPFGATQAAGFVIGRRDSSDYGASLRLITSVVSAVPVLSAPILALCQRIAALQAAPLLDVIRLAVPERHARAEREVSALAELIHASAGSAPAGPWEAYEGGAAYLQELASGKPVRQGVTIMPAHSDAQLLAPALSRLLARNKAALVLVPTAVAAQDLGAELEQLLPGEPIGVISSALSQEQRYRAFMGALLGRTRIVIGTRSAAFTPLPDLGLVALIDGAHAAYYEPRSPYVRAVRVLWERAAIEKCSFLALDRGPALWLAAGEQRGALAPRIVAKPAGQRLLMPQVLLAQDAAYEGAPFSRLPDAVFTLVRSGLSRGDVLVMVPRAGYVPAVACARCGTRAPCPVCGGWLYIPQADAPAQCTRCAAKVAHFECQVCGFRRLKAITIGSQRTAQEIGRAFPGVPIVQAREGVVRAAGRHAAIVVATPGSLLQSDAGYAAAVVLDAGHRLQSGALNAEAQFMRSLGIVAHHVRARGEQGQMLVVGQIPAPIAQLVRRMSFRDWEIRTLAERAQLQLPPSSVWAELSGAWEDIRALLGVMRGITLAHKEEIPVAADPGQLASAEMPLDALLVGGVHSVIPYLQVIGPTRLADGTAMAYLRFRAEQREWCARLIRQARQELMLRRRGKGVRVKMAVTP